MAVRYANWVTDQVIQRELYQNIGSSMLAIFITVLLFLGSFRGALFVIFCVFATVTEVAGFMYFLGLTIDVITCNSLVVSIGLCVDFSAHIAHGFISRAGTRDERVVQTMTKVPVANKECLKACNFLFVPTKNLTQSTAGFRLSPQIGPAVMNGGLSTMLAFILLSTSDTYVFLSFFKVNNILLFTKPTNLSNENN